MTYNDILRRLRYALDYNDSKMINIFSLGGEILEQSELNSLLKREDEDGYIHCSEKKLTTFLEGLIILNRGKKEDGKEVDRTDQKLTNNIILMKIRIALNFRGDDMVEIFKLGDHEVSKSEISALFRKQGHRNYKDCGEKYVRVFLRGLTVKFRGEPDSEIKDTKVLKAKHNKPVYQKPERRK